MRGLHNPVKLSQLLLGLELHRLQGRLLLQRGYLHGLSFELSQLQLHQLPRLQHRLLPIWCQRLLDLRLELFDLHLHFELSELQRGFLLRFCPSQQPVRDLHYFQQQVPDLHQNCLLLLRQRVLPQLLQQLQFLRTECDLLLDMFCCPDVYTVPGRVLPGLGFFLSVLQFPHWLFGLFRSSYLYLVCQWVLYQYWCLLRLSFGMHSLHLSLGLHHLRRLLLPVLQRMLTLLGRADRLFLLHFSFHLSQLQRRLSSGFRSLSALLCHYSGLFAVQHHRGLSILPAGLLPQRYQQLPALLPLFFLSRLSPLQLFLHLPVLLQWVLSLWRGLFVVLAFPAGLRAVRQRVRVFGLRKWVLPQRDFQGLSAVPDQFAGLHILLQQYHLHPVPRRLLPHRRVLPSLRTTRLRDMQRHHPHKLHHLQLRLLPHRQHLCLLSSDGMSRLQFFQLPVVPIGLLP